MAEGRRDRRSGAQLALVLAGVMVLATVGASYMTYLFVRDAMSGEAGTPGGPAARTSAQREVEVFGPTYNLGTFIANLRTPPGSLANRYVRVEVVLELANAGVAERLEARNPAVRNAVLEVLRGYSAEELAAPEAMSVLAGRVVAAANGVLGGKGVLQAFFTDLVIQ